MSYPGNPSLAADVRERIQSTFEQTLDLAAKGSTQEALLGCDFILRMDPDFQVAEVLQSRLRESSGPIAVDDLREGGVFPSPDEAPAAVAEGVIDLGDLDSLDGEMPDLSGWAQEPAPVVQPDALESALQDLLDARELQRLVKVADQHKEEVGQNPTLRKIVTTAYTRLEAEPYVLEFLASAREAMDAGNTEQVRELLEKARSLDPSHPGIEELSRLKPNLDAPVLSPEAAKTVKPPEEENFGTLLIPKSEMPVVTPPEPALPEMPQMAAPEAPPEIATPIAPPIDELSFGQYI